MRRGCLFGLARRVRGGCQPVVAVWRRLVLACLRRTTDGATDPQRDQGEERPGSMPASPQSIPLAEGVDCRTFMTVTCGALKVPRRAAASRVSGERRSGGV